MMNDRSGNIVVYVHGKGGSAEEVGHYRHLFPCSTVVGFDYHAANPWEAKEEFPRFFSGLREKMRRYYAYREQHRSVLFYVVA